MNEADKEKLEALEEKHGLEGEVYINIYQEGLIKIMTIAKVVVERNDCQTSSLPEDFINDFIECFLFEKGFFGRKKEKRDTFIEVIKDLTLNEIEARQIIKKNNRGSLSQIT